MIWKLAHPAPEEVEKNRKYQVERDSLYLEYDIDNKGMINFVIDAAEPFAGPVLDIGTGKGLAAIEIARRGFPVTTVDVSEEAFHGALLNAIIAGVDSSLEFHIVEENKLPFEDGSFNLITLVNVLHHLEHPGAMLPEISRVLDERGKLIISDFTEEGFRILDHVHGKEGRVHSRSTQETVESLVPKLQQYSLKCMSRDTRFHQYLMVAGKT